MRAAAGGIDEIGRFTLSPDVRHGSLAFRILTRPGLAPAPQTPGHRGLYRIAHASYHLPYSARKLYNDRFRARHPGHAPSVYTEGDAAQQQVEEKAPHT